MSNSKIEYFAKSLWNKAGHVAVEENGSSENESINSNSMISELDSNIDVDIPKYP